MSEGRKKSNKETIDYTGMLNTALHKFFDQGIRAVKMDDLSMEYGISKRTLYKIFPNKEELLMEALKLRQQHHLEQVAEMYAGSLNILEMLVSFHFRKVEEMREINYLFFKELEKYPKVMKFLADERENHRKKALLFFQQGVKEGLIKKDINLDLLIRSLYATNEAAFRDEWMKDYSLEMISDALLSIFIRGILTAEGLEIFERLIKKHEQQI